MRVLVAGGGIGGLSAALSLAQSGFGVEVFEQAPEFGEVGAGIQLSPNATRVLHHLGLAAALEACAFLPERTEFRAWRTHKLISANPLGATVRSAFGFPYYHIHRGDLLTVLVEAAMRTPGITLHTSARVEGFAQDSKGVHVTVWGKEHSGDALIGADGIHSTVRAGLFGPEAPAFTGNVAWRALVPASSLPEGLIPPAATVWWGPGGHFVCYYVRSGTLVNCVCVREKEGWEVESWTERGEYAELKGDFAGWNDAVQTLIDNADRDVLYKWAPPRPAADAAMGTRGRDAARRRLPSDAAVHGAGRGDGDRGRRGAGRLHAGIRGHTGCAWALRGPATGPHGGHTERIAAQCQGVPHARDLRLAAQPRGGTRRRGCDGAAVRVRRVDRRGTVRRLARRPAHRGTSRRQFVELPITGSSSDRSPGSTVLPRGNGGPAPAPMPSRTRASW